MAMIWMLSKDWLVCNMNQQRLEEKYEEIKRLAELSGHQLNPDEEFCKQLVEGLLINQDRYGFEACPCRLCVGTSYENFDVVCPCYYRDDDLAEYGACFCALFVSDTFDANRQIPDRRPNNQEESNKARTAGGMSFAFPIWRCAVCGYLCANNNPPGKCPICKASKERFEKFA